MKSTKVNFKNKQGEILSGYIEVPTNQEPHNFVLFAHCFTCNKNFFAVRNITQALTKSGYGVLGFDFTGLGESEGEFSDTNFSGNVEDILEAAIFLQEKYKAPGLLIGHSLGGAAVIFAARELPSVKAVVTIGSPSSPKHVTNLLKSSLTEIREKGVAAVNLGGRNFNIKEQFLEDLKNQKLKDIIKNFDKSLLILHSPQDKIVGIKNAEELYLNARHPKGFISLDGADHLLSDSKDSTYAGHVIGSWATRYVKIPEPVLLQSKHQVVANLGAEGFTTQLKSGKHYFLADEPEGVGGSNFGPDPYDFVSAGLAACTSMTIQMYARRKKWVIENVETHVNYSKEHAADCSHCEDDSARIDTFQREIVLQGDLDEKQQQRLLEIANKCPVHRTLHQEVNIITTLSTPKKI